MRAIEITYLLNWKNLWLETDSSLVVSAFNNSFEPVVWNLRNRWHTTLSLLNDMNCIVTHIHREGNQVADLLTKHGLSLPTLSHWNDAPLFIRDSLIKNQLGLPNFRFCTS
jgi:ribonuclease HI